MEPLGRAAATAPSMTVSLLTMSRSSGARCAAGGRGCPWLAAVRVKVRRWPEPPREDLSDGGDAKEGAAAWVPNGSRGRCG